MARARAETPAHHYQCVTTQMLDTRYPTFESLRTDSGEQAFPLLLFAQNQPSQTDCIKMARARAETPAHHYQCVTTQMLDSGYLSCREQAEQQHSNLQRSVCFR